MDHLNRPVLYVMIQVTAIYLKYFLCAPEVLLVYRRVLEQNNVYSLELNTCALLPPTRLECHGAANTLAAAVTT